MKKIIPVLVALLLVLSCVFVACDKDDYIADNTEHYDDITKTLKLNKTYADKDVLTDGIGEVDVTRYADGDTVSALIKATGAYETIRFYSVNTPESTGGVEKWGKAASNFTKEQLQGADLVVIEAIMVNGVPDRDTAGNRLLGYVWYRTKGETNLKLLNLELVENGYSENKCSPNDSYYNYFTKAAEFARKIKLRLYSSKDDPLFANSVKETTIKYWHEHPNEFAENEKISFYAYLSDLTVSQSGTHLFVATQYDEETGKTYSVNVYTGYANASGSKMALGDYYYISVTLQKYGESWQVSGIEYSDSFPDAFTTSIEQRNYYLTFDSSKTYTDNHKRNFYSSVVVVGAPVYDADSKTLTFVGKAKGLKSAGFTGEEETFTFTVVVPNGTNYQTLINENARLTLTGLQLVRGSGEVMIINYTDIS